MTNSSPIVIGHRGAAGYRPEHTMASFSTAIDLGADFIEPDLVSTKDHVLIVRHENELSRTTDVADRPEFAGRRATKVVDGRRSVGWFAEDFTFAEVTSLRCRERFPDLRQQNTLYDGRYAVPTFDEVISLARTSSAKTGRVIGVYPETKHPAYYRSIGLPLEPLLVDALRRHGLDRAFSPSLHVAPRLDAHSPVFVQSFGAASLRDINAALDIPLVQLLGIEADPHLLTRIGLREISTYADAIGVHKQLLSGALVAEAHSAGLLVHAYTLRNENAFLDPRHRRGDDPRAYGDAFGEYFRCYRMGVDGVFTDNADTAVAARTEFLRECSTAPPGAVARQRFQGVP